MKNGFLFTFLSLAFLFDCELSFGQDCRLSESFFYVTSNSCYDCRDCNSYTSTNAVKGDFKLEEKYVRILCDSESIGVVSIRRINECTQERFAVDFVDGAFRSESEAKQQLRVFAENMCANNEMIADGKIVNKDQYYSQLAEQEKIEKERQEKRRIEKEKILADLKSGLIRPDTIEQSNPIRTSNLTEEFILKGDWKLFKRRYNKPQRISFLEDGTYQMFDPAAAEGEEEETGTYFFNENGSVTLYRAPEIKISKRQVIINKETLSFWEENGETFVSSSASDKDAKISATAFFKDLALTKTDLIGDWHMQTWASRNNELIDMVYRIEMSGDSIIANLIHMQENGQVYCHDAYGLIKITEGSFIKIMVYFDGECCTGTQIELRGHASSDSSFFGEYYNNYGKPTGCAQSLWRADVSAKKLETPFDGKPFKHNKKTRNASKNNTKNRTSSSSSKSNKKTDVKKETNKAKKKVGRLFGKLKDKIKGN